MRELLAGGAAATGLALYYLLRDDGSGRKENEAEAKKFNKNEVGDTFTNCRGKICQCMHADFLYAH